MASFGVAVVRQRHDQPPYSGVHPKVVQERLGHSSIALTLDRYSHVIEGMDREAAEQVANLIGDRS